LPELAISRTPGHRAQQIRVYLNHFLYRLRRNVRALRRARINRDHHAVLENKTQRRGAVVGLDVINNLALEVVVL
tara:strand:+ start:816 stop:1040 length:225 start_codon:yes stop_codon:yes gene_type:complete